MAETMRLSLSVVAAILFYSTEHVTRLKDYPNYN
jgi:hypothetical protein